MPDFNPTHSSLTLSDGSEVRGTPDALTRVARIDRDMQTQKREWIAGLRARGVKAAHPDDGWVDRDKNRVHLCYPDFNDGLKVGDLLALGWPWKDTRIVRITATEDMWLAPWVSPWWWHFEAVS
jgi:hypothetical protein